MLDLGATAGGDRVDELAAGGRKCNANLSPIATSGAPSDETLLYEAFAHPRGGGRCDRNGLGQSGHTLRSPGGQHDERAVLGEGDLLAYVGQRARRDGDEDPAGVEHGVDQLVVGWRGHDVLVHSAHIVQRIRLTRKLLYLLVATFAVLVGTGVAAGIASSGVAVPGPPPASIGDQMDRSLPAGLINATFSDQNGDPVQLSAFAGEVVLLVPFLTSCQEECPVTTGALEEIERALVAGHVNHDVQILEVTVDPGRDTPERMAAYAKLTGTTWPLLTASTATIAALWHFFGIYYQVVPEGSPPGIDWQTHTPYIYDVDHSDGFVLLNSRLTERFVAAGMVRGATVTPALRRLLDSQGVGDLEHPGGGSWSVPQALDAIGWLLGKPVPNPAEP
ncbi:MAG TPA: SCO family protein [Acidimicrobiales bacterium]|nr:SCO family protein [Acidimicrobiales bacterium]